MHDGISMFIMIIKIITIFKLAHSCSNTKEELSSPGDTTSKELSSDPGRIINGINAHLSFMVLLIGYSKMKGVPVKICGGSLISEKFVVTSALCVIDTDNVYKSNHLFVYVGRYEFPKSIKNRKTIRKDVDSIATRYITLSDNYKLGHGNSDMGTNIALIELKHMARNVTPIILPDKSFPKQGFVAGYGNTVDSTDARYAKKLQMVTVNTKTIEECQKLWNNQMGGNTDWLCVQGDKANSGICRGDAGGPLFSILNLEKNEFKLHGVVVGGEKGKCLDKPPILVDVFKLKSWITDRCKKKGGSFQVS